MALPNATPPLLFTKRLAAFLHANQTPQLPTLLLTTSTGKLLAHASPHPVALLRTHATVAASLLAIHTSSSVAVSSALPGARSPDPVMSPPPRSRGRLDDEDEDDDFDDDEDEDEDDDEDFDDSASETPRNVVRAVKPVTITVQLSGGTVVIRRLKCGLLFVCVGPAGGAAAAGAASDQPELQQHLLHAGNGDIAHVASSPSEVESLMSAGGQTTVSLESSSAAAVVTLRRHASDLARWLDDKLGTLKVPEESVGVE
ncbi:hypothetical protein B0I35DRAFT_411039 [Stachybotrys elegans]|uniref:Uncharacterized protein n=1 Tax=Stachybotrys elegans TaxID=80388 RepID=A0A8K0SHA6_9HYPO|nr:hypothetical protein B0I35DRAFT_411039 [Stachybotrys elegans]